MSWKPDDVSSSVVLARQKRLGSSVVPIPRVSELRTRSPTLKNSATAKLALPLLRCPQKPARESVLAESRTPPRTLSLLPQELDRGDVIAMMKAG